MFSSNTLNELVKVYLNPETDDFILKLRAGKGIDQKGYRYFCNLLLSLKEEWIVNDYLPKIAANILVELYPEIIGCIGINKDKTEIVSISENIKNISKKICEYTNLRYRAYDSLFQKLIKYHFEKDSFYQKLKRGEGLDQDQLDIITNMLTEVSKKCKREVLLPKPLVLVLIELNEIQCFDVLYMNDPDKAGRIADIGYEISELVACCVSVDRDLARQYGLK